MSGILRLPRAETLPWFLVAALFVVLFGLIAASVATFTSVAEAHANATLSVRSTATYQGLSGAGLLLDNGTITFTIYLTVDNPSSRSLSFFTLGYRVWVEDRAIEQGLPGPIRNPADVEVLNATGIHKFYRAFDGSRQLDPYPVPAHGNATVPYRLTLKNGTNSRFPVVQQNANYAVTSGSGTASMVWNVWVLLNVDVGGIPAPSSPSGADYFSQISRIQFTDGTDFGEGAPVPGP